MEDNERFDIEKVEYDKDGIPVIPRIGFSVPRSYRAQFLQDMIDEVRSTPGEQLMAIFVKYMRARKVETELAAKATPESGRPRIPTYGPKMPVPMPDQTTKQKSDA